MGALGVVLSWRSALQLGAACRRAAQAPALARGASFKRRAAWPGCERPVLPRRPHLAGCNTTPFHLRRPGAGGRPAAAVCQGRGRGGRCRCRPPPPGWRGEEPGGAPGAGRCCLLPLLLLLAGVQQGCSRGASWAPAPCLCGNSTPIFSWLHAGRPTACRLSTPCPTSPRPRASWRGRGKTRPARSRRRCRRGPSWRRCRRTAPGSGAPCRAGQAAWLRGGSGSRLARLDVLQELRVAAHPLPCLPTSPQRSPCNTLGLLRWHQLYPLPNEPEPCCLPPLPASRLQGPAERGAAAGQQAAWRAGCAERQPPEGAAGEERAAGQCAGAPAGGWGLLPWGKGGGGSRPGGCCTTFLTAGGTCMAQALHPWHGFSGREHQPTGPCAARLQEEEDGKLAAQQEAQSLRRRADELEVGWPRPKDGLPLLLRRNDPPAAGCGNAAPHRFAPSHPAWA